jgi:hypothetical protein
MTTNHIPELICYPGAQNEFAIADIWAIDAYTPGEWNGVLGNLVQFYSDTPGQQVTIDISAIGIIFVSYVSFQDIKFIGGTVYADSITCDNLEDNDGIVWSTISLYDLSSYLNVVDFNISNVLSPVLSSNYTKVTLNYIGTATPTNTGVNLTTYQYSLDGITWSPMTVAFGSIISDLTFNSSGNSYPFIWSIRHDIGTNIYNIPIQVRFQATATFGSDVVSTSYKYVSVYMKKTITTSYINAIPVFSPTYVGENGYVLMKNAPKVT